MILKVVLAFHTSGSSGFVHCVINPQLRTTSVVHSICEPPSEFCVKSICMLLQNAFVLHFCLCSAEQINWERRNLSTKVAKLHAQEL